MSLKLIEKWLFSIKDHDKEICTKRLPIFCVKRPSISALGVVVVVVLFVVVVTVADAADNNNNNNNNNIFQGMTHNTKEHVKNKYEKSMSIRGTTVRPQYENVSYQR